MRLHHTPAAAAVLGHFLSPIKTVSLGRDVDERECCNVTDRQDMKKETGCLKILFFYFQFYSFPLNSCRYEPMIWLCWKKGLFMLPRFLLQTSVSNFGDCILRTQHLLEHVSAWTFLLLRSFRPGHFHLDRLHYDISHLACKPNVMLWNHTN